MPTIINGYLNGDRRRYAPSELISRVFYLARHPFLLTIREITLGIYLAYIAYITYYTCRSIAFLLFQEDGRHMWCPSAPPPEWGPPPPGWKMTWRICFRSLRWMVLRRLWAWMYEVFAWGFVGVVAAFILEVLLER
ncbi:uncharacterized protein CTRU02_210213 [Colletotrichum truncatum]|uniref:Uncharacterized protein n=1 Tax=Colletotrichum truncatum TaxID=5467 RepID=A0ACC3YUS7_COLTU|nr:uncharacterized protein CTRU02_11423 [Colletotrichum truncatum]KAF6785798.1 hypothetical protein CTRU02_11423 [Colletotrichum truncatum]